LQVYVLKVKVEYLGHVKKVAGDRRIEEIEIKGNATVGDLLTALSEKYGEPFRKAIYEPKAADVKSNFIVTVNGYLLNQLDGVQTRLKNRDHVVLMPIVSGG
jgi:MoaD family protein